MRNREKVCRLAAAVLILILMFSGLWYLWPYDGIHYDYEVERPGTESFETLELGDGRIIRQDICSERIYLKKVELILINLDETSDGSIVLRLYDDSGEQLARAEKPLEEIRAGEWEQFSMNVRLKRGAVYCLEIESIAAGNPYVLGTSGDNGPKENGQCCLNGEQIPAGILAGYGFAMTASNWEKMVITLLLLCGSLLLIWMLYGNRMTECLKLRAEKTIGCRVCESAVVVLLAVQFLLMVPNIVYRLENISLDPSWRYFLNVSWQEGLKFGRDIFFTYGPLGYLCYLMKVPGNEIAYWTGVVIWCAVAAVHIYLLCRLFWLYKSKRLDFTAIVLSVLCYIAAYYAPERDNYLLYLLVLSVVIWSLGARYMLAIPNLLLVLMFFCKFSTFTSGLAFVILYVFFDVIFHRRKKSIWLLLPAIVAMPCLYLIYCPSVQCLYEYVSGIIKISDGWMLTAQWDQAISTQQIKILAAIMIGYCVLVFVSLWLSAQNACVILACSASMFFVYKYAITRHGLAPGIWLFGMLFSAVVLSLDFPALRDKLKRGKAISYAVCTVAVIIIVGTGILQANVLHLSWGYVKEQFASKAYSWMHLQEGSIPEEVIAQNQLPEEILCAVGRETVTVYPWRNAYGAVHEELNMVYYPSVQNCNEFIPWLDSKVADYFCSDDAPQFVLLFDETIDDHIKYLDNPLTWEAIKNNYRVAQLVGEVCLLERTEKKSEPEMILLKSQECSVTDVIECPEGADYVKILLEFSGKGKLKKFFYHVGVVYMNISCADGSQIGGRAIVPNLISGFALEKPPQDLVELERVLNTGEASDIVSFTFGGLGIDDLDDAITVEWYQRQE